MSLKKASFFIFIILLVDQVSKIYIKTHFILGEDFTIFNWFKIFFIENKGMAWGTKLSDIFTFIDDRTAKICLTVFRLFAITGIGYWLHQTLTNRGPKMLEIALIFVFSGALGNIMDSMFYGLLFSDSTTQIATFLPEAGGYDTILHGRVVDMLYFPLWKGYLPEWIPSIGGQYFTFFEPVFNVADVAISIGFCILIFWNKKAFPNTEK